MRIESLDTIGKKKKVAIIDLGGIRPMGGGEDQKNQVKIKEFYKDNNFQVIKISN